MSLLVKTSRSFVVSSHLVQNQFCRPQDPCLGEETCHRGSEARGPSMALCARGLDRRSRASTEQSPRSEAGDTSAQGLV